MKTLGANIFIKTSKFIINSSFSGPGNEASHWADCLYAEPGLELAFAVRSSEGRGYDSRASNYGLLSWTSRLLLYHHTIEMKLRVNENIVIDSIDEVH